MFGNLQFAINSDPATDFIETILQDGISANYDFSIGQKYPMFYVNGFTLEAVQGLTYELWLFNSATNFTSDPETDNLVGMWEFMIPAAGSVGYPVTGSTLYRYHVTGNMIPYVDLDYARQGPSNAYPKLHMRLINRSATQKDPDAAGALKLTSFISTMAANW